jgi:hypothetical protein
LAGALEGEGLRAGAAVFEGETLRCAVSDLVLAIGFAGDFAAGLDFAAPFAAGDFAGVFAAGDLAGEGFAGDSASPDLEGDVDRAFSGLP